MTNKTLHNFLYQWLYWGESGVLSKGLLFERECLIVEHSRSFLVLPRSICLMHWFFSGDITRNKGHALINNSATWDSSEFSKWNTHNTFPITQFDVKS